MDGNDLIKSIANFAKGRIKRIGKKIVIIVSIFLLIIIMFCASIKDLWKKDTKNSNDPSSKYYRQYGPDAYVNSISISDNGTLASEITIEDMWKGDSRYKKYLSSMDVLEYLLNAQVVTQYPYIDSTNGNGLNGTIRFYRNNSSTPMTCIGSGNLQGYVDSYNSGNTADLDFALNSFSINEDGSIKIAYLTETTYNVTTNDSDAANEAKSKIEGASESNSNGNYVIEKVERKLDTKNISYKSYVSKYVLPFNYLWSIILMGHTSGDAEDLAISIAEIAHDGEISLIIDDNNNKTTSIDTYTYNRTNYYNGKITVSANEEKQDAEGNTSTKKVNDSKSVENYKKVMSSYTTVFTQIFNDNTPTLKKKKIESWCAIYESDATYTSTTSTSESENSTEQEDTEKVSSGSIDINGAVNVPIQSLVSFKNKYDSSKYKDVKYNGKIDVTTNYTSIELSNSSTVVYSGFSNGTVSSPIFNEKIVEVFDDCTPSLIQKICDGDDDSDIIKALQSNDDTANMVDLHKYICYMVTGIDYGVTEFDFSYFNRNLSTTTIGTLPLAVDKDTFYLEKDEFVSVLQSYEIPYGSAAEISGFRNFQDNAEFIYDECLENGINPIWCVAQGIQESGWGSTRIAVEKNNYWGIAASDKGEGAYSNAASFSNFKDAVTNGYIPKMKKYIEGGSKYPIMEHYVEMYQPYRSEITIDSIYAITAVYAPIYSDNLAECFKHSTKFGNGVYKQTVIQDCLITPGYISECNHGLDEYISVEEGAAYAIFYGNKITKTAAQIWGDKAFVPGSVTSTTGGVVSPTNNGLVDETYYLISEQDAEAKASSYAPTDPNWWYWSTYTNSEGLTYRRYFNMDTRITNKPSTLNGAVNHSCGIGALAIALSPYVSNVSPYNIKQSYGKWIPDEGWNFGEMIIEAQKYTSATYGTSSNILSNLQAGKTVIISVNPQDASDSILGKKVRYCSSASHYIVLIDYKVVNGNVLYYVDNPSGDVNYQTWLNAYGGAYGEGWVSANALMQIIRHQGSNVVIGN